MNPWHDPQFRAAWAEVSHLTPILDEAEERTGYETPTRDALLGGLVLLVLLLAPFLLAWWLG